MKKKFEDEDTKRILQSLHSKQIAEGSRKIAASRPKSLKATGIPDLIMASDPNPTKISNQPKKRFSKPQKTFLKSCYWTFAVYDGKLLKSPVISSFEEITGPYNSDNKYGTRNLKSSHSSMKRSAYNLAEYGYCTLLYDEAWKYDYWEEYDPHNFQPMLIVEATLSGVEKGRELLKSDGEDIDPISLKTKHKKLIEQWKKIKLG